MAWLRDRSSLNVTEWTFFISVIFFLIAFFLKAHGAAGIFLFTGLIAVMQYAYFTYIGTGLVYKNEKTRKAVLQGDQTEWVFRFENKGMPIHGALLKVTFDDQVVTADRQDRPYGKVIESEVPFTIGYKQTVDIRLPVIGNRRGVSSIQTMQVIISNPFGNVVLLKHQSKIRQQLLVYPEIGHQFPVSPASKPRPGQFEQPHSLFNDWFQIAGTRDYVPSDQFQHINWKASARLGTYQTKVFDKVADQSVLFAVNVASRYSTIPHLEERIREVVGLIESCVKENRAFSLAVNVRAFGKVPYHYLPEGAGQRQRQKALELLSVLSKDDPTVPFENMLAHLELHTTLPAATTLFADEMDTVNRFSKKWHTKTLLDIRMPAERGRIK